MGEAAAGDPVFTLRDLNPQRGMQNGKEYHYKFKGYRC